MVKRQTVWLSTMMVLSLMLIGYYTMNNETSTTTSAANQTDVATSVAPTGTVNTSGSTGSGQANEASTSTSTSGSSTSTTDWFVNMETNQEQQMSKEIDTQRAILANNNASSEQLSQAEQKLNQLTTEQGELANAREIVLGKGYQDCFILPNADNTKFTVYVKSSSKITPEEAVAIMNAVSQQLNTSAANIVVQQK
ncbi:MAG: SpoIIIAH-like family protein [Alicyclobacillus sp.]|nr:SpoIIIAH-like family protein [Alicyclobacillus sp.]